MSMVEIAQTMSIEEIESVLQQRGTVAAVVEYITGGKRHERVRAIIAERVREAGLEYKRRANLSNRYTVQQVVNAFTDAICWSDIYRALELTVCDHNKRGVVAFAKHHDIPVPEFSKEDLTKAYRRGKSNWTTEGIFCKDSTYPRPNLRVAVIKYKMLNYYHCSSCNIQPEWNGKELLLELDHMNGVHNDNRVENLRWLCPNCHSQTHTFKGKKR